MKTPPSPPPVLVCASAVGLRMMLEESLAEGGYAVTAVEEPEQAVAKLREAPYTAMILQSPRDGFSKFVRAAAVMWPKMPVHVIDNNAVFCFYPLGRQPFKLLDAIMAAGVSISPDLLRHTRADRPRVEEAADPFMV